MLAVGLKGLNPVFPTAWSSGTVLSLLIAQSLAGGLAHHRRLRLRGRRNVQHRPSAWLEPWVGDF